MIQIKNLRKSFGHRAVVQDLSFNAPDGAITGLLGANGAGKSTTLRMICGVLKPDSGSIQIDDAAHGSLARCSITLESIRGSPFAKTSPTSENYKACRENGSTNAWTK